MPIENRNRINLSIAIPTYNGVRYIKEALDSIVCQLNGIDNSIEIVVSDNASTDRTPEIIREYQQKYSFIKYFRNTENLGPDSNFNLAVRRSTGEFVWLFSGNDKLKPGAIKKVLEVLRNYPELAAIFVNWSSYDDTGKCDSQPVIRTKKDILFRTADDFLFNIRLNATFVSSDIVRRSLWEQANPEIYIGTSWIQYAVLLTLIKNHHSYCIAESYIMHMHRGGSMSSGNSGEKGMRCAASLMKILNGLKQKGYSKKSINKVIGVELHHLPMEIVVHKNNGLTFNKIPYKDIIAQFKFYPFFWLVILPLLIIPNIFHKIVFKIYKIELINKLYRKIMSKCSLFFH